MIRQSPTSFVAGETIPAGARVKFNGSFELILADSGDVEIGTAKLHSGKASYAAGEAVSVQLISDGSWTRTCIAASAIAALTTVKRADDGQVDDAGAGDNFGIALEAASAGDFFEVLQVPGMFVTVADGAVTTAKLADANVTAAKLAAQVQGTADGLGFTRMARATFNPSANAGERTIGAHTLGVTVPDDAIITRFFYEVNTTFTSATDSGTIAFHVEGAGDLLAAIAISDASNVLDAGLRAGKPGYPNFGADAAHDSQPEVAALHAATFVKTSAARLITATVAVEALTAGKATLFAEYVQGA